MATNPALSIVGKAALLLGLAVTAGLTIAATADRGGISAVDRWPFGISRAQLAVAAAVEREDGTAAIDAAKKLVAQAPLRRSNLSLLATAEQVAGNGQASADIFRAASALGWRDELAQGNAVNFALSNGEYAIAASRMEALVRAAPDSEISRQLLQLISSVPESRAALAAAMAAGDGWGDNVVNGLHQLPLEEAAARIPLIAEAYDAGFRPTTALARREAFRVYAENPLLGWAVWNALAGPGEMSDAGIWNTDFSTMSEGAFAGQSPFEWARARQTTQTLRPEQVEGKSRLIVTGRALSAENVAQQRVALSAGRYALAWEASAATAGRPDLLLSADCAAPPGALEMGSAVFDNGSFYRLLTVPASCTLVELRVFAPSDGGAERWIGAPRILPID